MDCNRDDPENMVKLEVFVRTSPKNKTTEDDTLIVDKPEQPQMKTTGAALIIPYDFFDDLDLEHSSLFQIENDIEIEKSRFNYPIEVSVEKEHEAIT